MDEQKRKSPEDEANCCSRLFFFWVLRFIWTGPKYFRNITQFPETPKSLDIESKANQLRENFEMLEKQGRPNLLCAVTLTFWRSYIWIIFAKIGEMLSVVFISLLMFYFVEYFEDSDSSIEDGWMYLGILAVLIFLAILFFNHSTDGAFMSGGLMQAASLQLVIQKFLSFRINDDINIGKIMNMTANDLEFFQFMTCLDTIFVLPINVIVWTILICSIIGWAGIITIVLFLLLTLLSLAMGNPIVKYRIRAAKLADKRNQILTDVIEGIHVVKQQTWEKPYIDIINNLREKEIEAYKTAGWFKFLANSNALCSFAPVLFFTIMIPIWNGQEITLAQAVATISMLFPMQTYITSFTSMGMPFLGNLLEANMRITKTLVTNTFNYNYCKRGHPVPFMKLANNTQESINVSNISMNFVIEIYDLSTSWKDQLATIHTGGPGDTESPRTGRVLNFADRGGETDRTEKTNGPNTSHNFSSLHSPNHGKAFSIDLEGLPSPKDFKPLKTSADMIWDTVSNINLQIERGKLYTIIGPAGSGKTSLLMSILGELNINSGTVWLEGSIAYTSQDPWLITGSIRENILMDREHDPVDYARAIESCQLTEDIKALKNGDETIIGDQSVSINNGMQARISLARAVYSNKDIYLLDDPIGSMDDRTAAKVLQDCIFGALKNKTRILVSQQMSTYSTSDYIILMEMGKIKIMGTYDEVGEDDDVSEITELSIRQERQSQTVEEIVVSELEIDVEEMLTVPEEVHEGFVPFSYYLKYLKASWGNCCPIFIILAVSVLFQIFYMAVPWWTIVLVDNNDQADVMNVCIYGGICLCVFLGGWLRNVTIIRILLDSSLDIFQTMLSKVISAKSLFFDINPSRRILNRFSNDANVTNEMLLLFINIWFQTLFILIGVMITLAVANPYTIILLALLIIVFLILVKHVTSCGREAKRIEMETKNPLFTLISNCQEGLESIRAFGYQKILSGRLLELLENNFKAFYVFHKIHRVFTIVMLFAFHTLMWLSCVYLVTFKDSINVETAVISLAYITLLFQVVAMFGRSTSEVLTLMPSVQRILDYSDLEPENYAGKAGFKVSNARIEFQDVYMRYQDDSKFVLKGFSMNIDPGTKVGLIGKPGAGKSTIMQILFRLKEIHSGTILIDGQDISMYSLLELRSQISVIQQNPIVFATTVKENLDPFDQYTEEELWEVLLDTQLNDHFDALPQNINTVLDEQHIQLSTGQKQLLSLARAILSRNKILMLDDATANVDEHTDKIIQQTIKEKFSTCTVLTIAHRMNTILGFDKLAVLEDGKCIEFDAPELLLNDEESHFYSMSKSFYDFDK